MCVFHLPVFTHILLCVFHLPVLIHDCSLTVELHLEELDKECEEVCASIETAGRSLLISLTPQEAEMSILETRSEFIY